MSHKLNITYDSELIDLIASDFELRKPNKDALRKLIFTLDGEYDPEIMQVLNMATGVGKTYLMAAFIEYLRRQGIQNVLVVTPGKVVQSKTVCNFSEGQKGFISGAEIVPLTVTPQDYTNWTNRMNGQGKLNFYPDGENEIMAFIFNIQQLIAPKSMDGSTHDKSQEAERRKPRRFDESSGVLFDYLRDLEDLVVIADESHLYSSSAAAFHSALKELDPAAIIGLTASSLPDDHVIFKYPLYKAIEDKYVKAPVLAFRKGGYSRGEASEEQQLRDAIRLRDYKQSYYDIYTSQQHLNHLNAVLFVVCADVDHATQVAELLRSADYFNNQECVLQIDSKHDDEKSIYLLENLDSSFSPVKAVVSVNKLKEGWDVKNIAVVATLRAMSSEVLTQQTMGRGLRLPFGKYTDIPQIDQLDIIAHQSFEELLSAENVLVQFGLDDAINPSKGTDIKDSLINSVTNSEVSNGDGTSETDINDSQYFTDNGEDTGDDDHRDQDHNESDPAEPTLPPHHDEPGVSTRLIHGDDDLVDPISEIVTIQPNPLFKDVTYNFPVTRIELTEPEVLLDEIETSEIIAAAERVTSSGEVIYRKEIIAALGKEKQLKAIDTVSAEVDSIKISKDEAKKALLKMIAGMQIVPKTQENITYLSNYFIDKFMNSVKFDEWSVKSLDSAKVQIETLIKKFIKELKNKQKETSLIFAKQMKPVSYQLRPGENVLEPIENQKDKFIPRQYYSGWSKSLYTEESFDSYSGEYLLAKLLNTSPDIKWFHRLHRHDGAFIYYTPTDRYYPDFVACDKDNNYWIIEGKNLKGRDDNTVQLKKKAAENIIRKLAGIQGFSSNHWGYLIAYEDDIANADTWGDLILLSNPVTNKI